MVRVGMLLLRAALRPRTCKAGGVCGEGMKAMKKKPVMHDGNAACAWASADKLNIMFRAVFAVVSLNDSFCFMRNARHAPSALFRSK